MLTILVDCAIIKAEVKNMKTVPITLITGYLGSGKTTLINKILSNKKGYKIAVIVNDIGEVNLDAELIQRGGVVNLNNDSLVALQNGCICCTLNKDLIKQILNLCQSGKFDHIMIEASGICEPMPIVQSIIAIEEECQRRNIPPVCRLDAVVSVADAVRLTQEFSCGDDLKKKDLDEEDIENLIIQQLEFCDVVIINKVDSISKLELDKVKSVIHELQPSAKTIETNYADIEIEDILDTNLFDYEKSFEGAGWMQALDKPVEEHDHDEDHEHHHDHEEDDDEEDEDHEHGEHEHHHKGHEHHHDESTSEEYGISTFVYFRRKPFNRIKFLQWVNENWGREIIRTKGLVYFEDEKDMSYLFEQAGSQKNLSQTGLWYATLPKNEISEMLVSDPMLRRDWSEEYGDRMIKLVFIGQKMDKNKITSLLDNM